MDEPTTSQTSERPGAESAATYDHAAGRWSTRDGVAAAIAETIGHWIPDPQVQQTALALLAFAIENADVERSDSWYIRRLRRGVRLMTGRIIACEVSRAHVRLSVIGPIDEALRERLGAEPESDEEFRSVPGAVLLKFPVDRAPVALAECQAAFDAFVDMAMARVRRPPGLDEHTPEAVEFIASVVGRDLPQPTPALVPDVVDDSGDEEEEAVSRDPLVRGRPPIFDSSEKAITTLMGQIEQGDIALPDLQRPFVWDDTQVRTLLDSLFVGFPVGTIVLWHTVQGKATRAIGSERPGLHASTLVIDGQQRLTSLYAVMRGVEVLAKDGERRKIVIAFRPRDGRFEVADAAVRNNPEFITDVSELWRGPRSKPRIKQDLLNDLRAKGREVNDAYVEAVEVNLDRAHAIQDYKVPTVDIRSNTASADDATDEDVAEVFVRINNQGTRLRQAEFVLTLLSVFHGDLRDRLERRATEMSKGAAVAIDTQQLLRAACAVAFGRARMASVYKFLRGVDPVTGDADPASRARRLDQLDEAAAACMEPTPWMDYLLRVSKAGFVSQSLIASKSAAVNAFAFYVRARQAGVAKERLDAAIARWLFGSLLTARYSMSSETVFEQDLARVAQNETSDPDGIVKVLDDAMAEVLTGDYWSQTLVAALATQKGRAPTALAFRAAQIVLGARALFSDQSIQTLITAAQGGRAASELHHLFPVAWLSAQGVRERRQVNQVANLADVGWYENAIIGSQSPAQYVPRVRTRLDIDDATWGRSCAEHGLPPDWESMDYNDFLIARRRRMADIIRVAYRKLGGEADLGPVAPPWFLPGTEEAWTSIAETERSLRALVRGAYAKRFEGKAAAAIEGALSEPERQSLSRALRSRPAGADPLTIVDYLYLGQLPALLFANDVWPQVSAALGGGGTIKRDITEAVGRITKVRNEIAHVREVASEEIMRALVACADLKQLLGAGNR